MRRHSSKRTSEVIQLSATADNGSPETEATNDEGRSGDGPSFQSYHLIRKPLWVAIFGHHRAALLISVLRTYRHCTPAQLK